MEPDAEQQPQEGQANESQQVDNSGGHPAWQPILDQIPDSLHSVIRPELENWDKGVQTRFQEIHSKYDPYKEFVDNSVDPDLLQRALGLVQELQQNPADVIAQAIEAFGLGYVPKDQVIAASEVDNNDDDIYGDDVVNDPRFKAMQEAVEALQGRFEQEDQKSQQAQQAEAFEKQLSDLETKNGSFDRMYVTALMSQGVDGAEAVKQYQQTVNQAAAQLAGQTQKPPSTPIIMGDSGTTGSGLPENPISMGGLQRADVNKLVVEMLNRSNET